MQFALMKGNKAFIRCGGTRALGIANPGGNSLLRMTLGRGEGVMIREAMQLFCDKNPGRGKKREFKKGSITGRGGKGKE